MAARDRRAEGEKLRWVDGSGASPTTGGTATAYADEATTGCNTDAVHTGQAGQVVGLWCGVPSGVWRGWPTLQMWTCRKPTIEVAFAAGTTAGAN